MKVLKKSEKIPVKCGKCHTVLVEISPASNSLGSTPLMERKPELFQLPERCPNCDKEINFEHVYLTADGERFTRINKAPFIYTLEESAPE